jgi:hypothetical protein
MSLSSKQRLFTHMVGKLIVWAYDNGYELTFGDAYRDPRLAKLNEGQGIGISNSLHTIRLAVDLNLFKDGEYMTNPEAYAPLGAFWKSLGGDLRWGGDFKSRDANHFSLEHEGVK